MAVLCREGKFLYLRSLNHEVVRAEKYWYYDLPEISQKYLIYLQIIPLQVLGSPQALVNVCRTAFSSYLVIG